MARLDHLALAVHDPRRSLQFYRDTLGVEGALRVEPYGFVITTPSGLAFTLFEGEPASGIGEFHFGLSLPDGDAVRARRQELRDAGIAECEWSDEDGYVSVKVRDPDGYVVEIAWDEKHAGA
jgi:catechol 2,3-dioxygenase-like lactoylglutathione lyase family enzyme